MLKHSKLASQLLYAKEELRKPAKALAVHSCNGHFAKIEAFWDSMLRRGGIVMPGVELTWASWASGGNDTNLVFVGDEKSVLEALHGIKIERQPVPESVAIKMLHLRMMKIVKGIADWNDHEKQREKAAAQAAQVSGPSQPGQVYKPELLPELELSDLPNCIRFARHLNKAELPTSAWQYAGDGKAILELQKIWRRPEITQKVIEAAWKLIEVHKVMTA